MPTIVTRASGKLRSDQPEITTGMLFESELLGAARVNGQWLLLRLDPDRGMLALVDATTFDEIATAPTPRTNGGPSPGGVLPEHQAATITPFGMARREGRNLVLRDWNLSIRWEIDLADTVTDVAAITTSDAVAVDVTSAGTDRGRALVGYS